MTFGAARLYFFNHFLATKDTSRFLGDRQIMWDPMRTDSFWFLMLRSYLIYARVTVTAQRCPNLTINHMTTFHLITHYIDVFFFISFKNGHYPLISITFSFKNVENILANCNGSVIDVELFKKGWNKNLYNERDAIHVHTYVHTCQW